MRSVCLRPRGCGVCAFRDPPSLPPRALSSLARFGCFVCGFVLLLEVFRVRFATFGDHEFTTTDLKPSGYPARVSCPRLRFVGPYR